MLIAKFPEKATLPLTSITIKLRSITHFEV